LAAENLRLRRRAVESVFIYPPDAYFYIPYLAPWLLAGYVQDRGHKMDVLDWNIEFHMDSWFGATARNRPSLFRTKGDRVSALLAELVEGRGRDAWEQLRQVDTYNDIDAVHRFSSVLNLGQELGETLRRDAYVDGRELPDTYGQWGRHVDAALQGEQAAFFSSQIEAGAFDQYEVICISATYLAQTLSALVIARLAKLRNPAVRVVLGGGAVTHLLEHLEQDPSFFADVDAVVPYEGEFSLAGIMDAVAEGAELDATNVMTLRNGAVQYEKDFSARPRVEAKPNFDILEHNYPTPHPIIPILTSKGCYWGKCTFCTHFEGYGEGYFAFGRDFTGEQVSELVEKGFSNFYFVDEALPPKRLGQFVDLFQEAAAAGRSVSWMAEARLEKALVSEAAVQRLSDSGCKLLVNGIETGSARIADLMRKGIDLELVERHANLCREAGVRTGWMFFVGFPGEEPSESQETFDFIRRNRESLAFASVGSFVLERGAPVYLAPGEFGIDEILNADEAYAVAFDYSMDGTLRTASSARRELLSLHQRNADLNDVFASAVDRSLMMFVPGDVDVRSAGSRLLRGELSVTAWSPSEEAQITLVLPRQQLYVEKQVEPVGAE
jgi:hypothetical protein